MTLLFNHVYALWLQCLIKQSPNLITFQWRTDQMFTYLWVLEYTVKENLGTSKVVGHRNTDAVEISTTV